jgi:hypothetical protein
MKKLAGFLALSALLGCRNQVGIVVQVDPDPALIQGQDIRSLRLILSDTGGNNGSAEFDNNGDPISFPVTFSTRVDVDRANSTLNVAVVALNEKGIGVASGQQELSLPGQLEKNQEVLVGVDLNNEDPCFAGDGADLGCCTDLLDNDNNGRIDCIDQACVDAFPDLCADNECGDGVTNLFAGELCDPNDPETQDGCNVNCTNDKLTATALVRYDELGLDANDPNEFRSGFFYSPLQSPLGFFATQTFSKGETTCQVRRRHQSLDQLQNLDVFFFFPGQVQLKNGAGAVVQTVDPDLLNPENFFVREPVLADGAPFTVETQVQANDNLLVGKQLANANAPTRFSIDAIESFGGDNNYNQFDLVDIIRGEDFLIEWTPTGIDEPVVFSIETFPKQVSIVQNVFITCVAPDAAGKMIVPGPATAALQRQATFFDAENNVNIIAYFASFGHGFIANPTPIEIADYTDANGFFIDAPGQFEFSMIDGFNAAGGIE